MDCYISIMLDEFDTEVERQGHKFCRCADDQHVYVGFKKAGERGYNPIKKYREAKLKRKVNEEKSAAAKYANADSLGTA